MSNIKPHLAILGANLIYGVNYSIAKDVMPTFIKPFGFIFCRVLGALILFTLVSSFFKEKIEKKDFGRLAICGFFGVAANQLMFFYGLNLTNPINAGIIMTANPIMVLLASAFILNTRITYLKIIGLVLGISGALMILLFKKGFSFGSETWVGDLFIFLNATSYAIYLVLVKPLMHKYSPITVIKWVFTFGFLYVLPFGFNQFTEINWTSFTGDIWLKFAFVIVATTFLAYLFNIYGLKRLNPSIVSTYIYLQPLIAALFAIWVGKDSFTWIKLTAAVLIFTGVYLVSKPQKFPSYNK
ncbi:MAG: DMT family transporter [Flavobacteriales bacterium]|nr:DMT family transporter [Flavobacteriales bacterium]MCB9174587.1 DMT family transporter [Flavobacteriales bacterium]